VRNSDIAELFESGLKVVGVFEAFVSEPINVEAGLFAGEKPACAHFSLRPFSPVLEVMVVEYVVLNGVDEAEGQRLARVVC
jgi:hypothetical protein